VQTVRRYWWPGFLIAGTLLGCADNVEVQYESDGVVLARTAIETLKAGDTEKFSDMVDPSARKPNDGSTLIQLRNALNTTTETRLVHFTLTKSLTDGTLTENLIFHARGETNAYLVNATVRRMGSTSLTSFQLIEAPVNLYLMNAFTPFGMRTIHYAMAVLALLVLGLSIATAIIAVASSRSKKWLWLPITLIGLGRFDILWSPEAGVSFHPIAVQVLGIGFVKSPMFAPWNLSVSIPVGALLYWIVVTRDNLKRKRNTAATSSISKSPVEAEAERS